MIELAELSAMLLSTLEDGALSRSERAALRALLEDEAPSHNQLAAFRNRAFAIAVDSADAQRTRDLLKWLEGVIKLFIPSAPARPPVAEVCFSPGDACLRLIQGQLDGARESADICVFTITDDRISARVLAAHQRGVRVRILTDDDKSEDPGSDIARLEAAGVPVRRDRTEAHMHHKFAVFDDARLVSGSYNWTRSAAAFNDENLLLTGEPRLVGPYRQAFESLWGSHAAAR